MKHSWLAAGTFVLSFACRPAWAEDFPAPKQSYEELLHEITGFRDALRGIPCYTNKGQLDALWAKRVQLREAADDLEERDPDRMHEGASWRRDRLNTANERIYRLLEDLQGRPCIPPNGRSTRPPDPEHDEADLEDDDDGGGPPPPEHAEHSDPVGDILSHVTIGVDVGGGDHHHDRSRGHCSDPRN